MLATLENKRLMKTARGGRKSESHDLDWPISLEIVLVTFNWEEKISNSVQFPSKNLQINLKVFTIPSFIFFCYQNRDILFQNKKKTQIISLNTKNRFKSLFLAKKNDLAKAANSKHDAECSTLNRRLIHHDDLQRNNFFMECCKTTQRKSIPSFVGQLPTSWMS